MPHHPPLLVHVTAADGAPRLTPARTHAPAALQLKEVVGAEAVEAQEAAMPGLSRAQLDMFLKDWASARIGTGKGHDRAAGAPHSTPSKRPQPRAVPQPLTCVMCM